MDGDQQPSRIYVCARVRPIIPEDFKLGTVTRSSPEICVHLKHDGQTIKMTKDVYDVKMFRVDHTFDAVANQLEVYASSFKRIVKDALNGYNGTGMVYGQTGSGKSYTMFGIDTEPGLVHLAINDVFTSVRECLSKGLVANVFLSFYQLYLEQAFDLLVGPVSGKLECTPLAVREDAEKGAFVENLRYVYVDDEQATVDVLKQGLKSRKVQSTQFNMSSSRSHAIFQMYLDFEETGDGTDPASQPNANSVDNGGTKKFNVRRRVLTFVDLAGSERVQTHHQTKSKTQFKESVTINKSISALGNCIQALANSSSELVDDSNGYFPHNANQQKRNLHIPFRDCKLTRLLAEPLGGNSKTCIIVNIGPCYYNYEETKSTLKFARRAMAVKKSVKKSEIEQLHVEDVVVAIEEPPEAASASSPSPPRVGIGAKLVPNVKISRIVVRTSPEERMRQAGSSSSNSGYLYDEQASLDGFRDNFESVRNQLQFHGASSFPGSAEEEDGGYERRGGRQNESYVLHLPAGSEFDEYGSLVDGAADADGQVKPAVRLNLGDFLKACQANSSSLLRSNSFSATNTNGVTSNHESNYFGRENEEVNGTPGRSKNKQIPLQMQGFVAEHFLHAESAHASLAPLSLESTLTPIADVRSAFSPYVSGSFSTTNMSLGFSPTPTSALLMNDREAREVNGEQQRTAQHDTMNTPGADERVAPDITLPSPHANLDNGPLLQHQSMRHDFEVDDSPQMASPTPVPSSVKPKAASEPVVVEDVAAPRTHRRFVFERGSGEPYYNTVEITPLLNRQNRRTASVASVAPVSTGMHTTTHYFPDDPNPVQVQSPISLKHSANSAKKSRKVVQYLKCAPSADVDTSLQSQSATPSTAEKRPTAGSTTTDPLRTPHKTMGKAPTPKKTTTLTVTTVRDETNTTPRSEVPQPTPSPSPTKPSRTSFAKSPLGRGTAGPYTFHQANPAPAHSKAARLFDSPSKRSVSWNDNHGQNGHFSSSNGHVKTDKRDPSIAPKLSAKLASTVVPFGSAGLVGPHSDAPSAAELQALLGLGKKASPPQSSKTGKVSGAGAPAEKTEGDAQHSQEWISLVKELREELQRKEEEITTLRSFILNN